MAELSTMPSSPPPLSDPLLPKSDKQMDSTPPIPKSSLYANKAAAATPPGRALSNAPPQNVALSPVHDPAPPGLEPGSNATSSTSPPGTQLRQTENHVRKETGASVPLSPSTEGAPTLYPCVRVTQGSENAGVPNETPQIAPLSDSVRAKVEKQDLTEAPLPQSVQEITATAETGNPPLKPDGETGNPPLKPDGETGNPPLKADGETGNPPLKPDRETGSLPLKPDGETGNLPLKPDGETGTLPLKPDEETGNPPLKPDGETGNPPLKPDRDTGNPPLSPLKPDGHETEPERSPGVPVINEPEEVMSSGSPVQLPPPPHPVVPRQPAPDTLSYLESASLMSGTMESLSGLGEDGSSVGSDSEINGLTVRRTDKYGFLGGSQYSESGEKELRVEVSRQREMKWLDMFNHWDKWVKHRFQKVKMRCRKGIPSSLRAKAWQLLSNSQDLLLDNPGKFEELEREPGEAKWLDIIEKDLHRQFPFHEMFAARGGHGQQDLFRILKAYTVYRPDEGYCQAQAPVAAVLLMHMPAEQAFWCLVQICEKYLPGYYSAGLEAIQLDGEIFFSLLRRTCPMAYRHLKKFKIDPILYMTEWFMCIFSRTLPWASVLRVWDMFFCEGVKIVFRVGLVLLKQMLGSVDKLRELQGMYETMERLRNISPDLIHEEVLVQEIESLPVTEALIERECGVQVRKWRESRGELTHEPRRRLHGTRHIYELKRRAAALASGGSYSFLGSPVPPPGPLRASSSLLSLPGFRRSKTPFSAQPKKASFSGPSRSESPAQSPPAFGLTSTKPPLPPPKAAAHIQSPLATADTKTDASRAQNATQNPPQNAPQNPPQNPPQRAPNTLTPSPKVVSEQITPKIPSPTANNAPLPPCPAAEKKDAPEEAEDGGRKGGKKTKEDKKREKEDERKRAKEKREKEKAEKERLKKEKERQEREKKRSAKKKQHGGASGGGAEEVGGATAAKDGVI